MNDKPDLFYRNLMLRSHILSDREKVVVRQSLARDTALNGGTKEFTSLIINQGGGKISIPILLE